MESIRFNSFDLIDFIKKNNTKKRLANPPSVGSIYYASELNYVCPRFEVLANMNNIVITKQDTADDLWSASVGKAFHSALQNDIWLRQYVDDRVIEENASGGKKSVYINDFSNVFRGNWKCDNCGSVFTGREDIEDETYFVDSFAIVKPEKCTKCSSRKISYKEIRICNEKIGIVCKIDGFLKIPELERLTTVEFKTLNSYAFRSLEHPRIQDIVQANIIMRMTNTDFCLLIYVSRGEDTITKGLNYFWIKHDESISDREFGKVQLIWDGIARNKLPFRECYGIKDDRASHCSLRSRCFIAE